MREGRRADRRHPAQQRQGEAGARRGGGIDDGAAGARHRDRAHRRAPPASTALYVDLEHSSFSLETTGQICMAALEVGIAPFVRVPANTPDYVSRVLDGGALGVIAPHIRSAQEARAVVKAAKYPPLGERSNAGGLPHLHFRSFPAAEANAALNDATMVIVQFESAATLAQIEEIIAVDGVDMVLIGLNDLLADWGIPGQYDIRACARPMRRTIAACRKPRQALRRRRARHAARSGGRVRPHGRALRLDRHRSRLSARRLHGAGEAGAGDQALMAAPQADRRAIGSTPTPRRPTPSPGACWSRTAARRGCRDRRRLPGERGFARRRHPWPHPPARAISTACAAA